MLKEAVDRDELTKSKLQGTHRMLKNKYAANIAYLEKLEAQKGSDISAKRSTQTAVALEKQLASLQNVFIAFGIQVEETEALPVRRVGGIKGKNTIVRHVLAEIKNSNFH